MQNCLGEVYFCANSQHWMRPEYEHTALERAASGRLFYLCRPRRVIGQVSFVGGVRPPCRRDKCWERRGGALTRLQENLAE